jgi:3,5-epimerase/4-reductase
MRILLFGSRGWIASQWIDHVKTGWTVIPATSRADNKESVLKELEEVKPDRVVIMIGRTHGPGFSTIDYLEQPGKLVENLCDNLFAPLQIAMLTRDRNIHTTYLGTGCIFDGYEREYKTDDLPDFFGSQYSVVKGYTDRLMKLCPHVLNLRIRMPITRIDNPRNFISKIIRYKYVCSTPNSMTVLDDFFPIFTTMIESGQTGTFNCTNPGGITHEEIFKLYQEIVDPSFTYNLCTKEVLANYIVSARSNNILDTSGLIEYYNVPPIHDAIRTTLNHWQTTSKKEE